MNWRRVALWLHSWLGITVGAWLAVVGLTGAILVWRPEIEPKIDTRRVVSGPSSKIEHSSSPSLQKDYETVQQAYPRHKIDRIYLARGESGVHEFRVKDNSGAKDGDDAPAMRVFVNPYNGQITGAQPSETDFFSRVDELHVRLLFGEVGHTIVGIAGGCLLLMALTGLWLWWPRRNGWKRAFIPQLKTNWRGRNYELHRVTGAIICVLFIGEALTGMALVWSAPTQSLLERVFSTSAKAKAPKAQKGELLALDTYIDQTRLLFPNGQLTRFTFPKKAGAPLVVRLQQNGELNPAGNTFVSLDPTTAKVLLVENSEKAKSPTRVMNLRYPIHTGRWGGTGMRVVYTLLGLSLPCFYLSGLVLWWNKRKKKRPTPVSKVTAKTGAI